MFLLLSFAALLVAAFSLAAWLVGRIIRLAHGPPRSIAATSRPASIARPARCDGAATSAPEG